MFEPETLSAESRFLPFDFAQGRNDSIEGDGSVARS